MRLSPGLLLLSALVVLSMPASAADDGAVRLLEARTIDLVAGPANRVGLLSPDGRQVLYVGDKVCVFDIDDGGEWTSQLCMGADLPRQLNGSSEMLWSPSGDALLLPTFSAAFKSFRDTDIGLLSSSDLTQRMLTEDGISGSLLKSAGASLDVSPRWIGADTIAFIRYVVGDGGRMTDDPPRLMTIPAGGGAATQLLEISAGPASVYALAISPDGATIAYAVDNRVSSETAGIFVVPATGGDPVRIAGFEAMGERAPVSLAFSADGTQLLALGPNAAGTGVDAHVIDAVSGHAAPVDASRTIMGAAWAPEGAALAYIAHSPETDEAPGGLFAAATPGEPGHLLLEGRLLPPFCCGDFPFVWASDDTLLLSDIEDGSRLLHVRLETSGDGGSRIDR